MNRKVYPIFSKSCIPFGDFGKRIKTNEEGFKLVDDFDVEPLYEDRTYERHQFTLSIDGRKYKGDFHEGEIHWLHPHPKQDFDEEELNWVEAKVHKMLGEHHVKETMEGIEVTPILKDRTHKAHQFKLTLEGTEYKGMLRDDKIEWFHPKPRRKLEDEHVELVEKKVYEKVKEHKEKYEDN